MGYTLKNNLRFNPEIVLEKLTQHVGRDGFQIENGEETHGFDPAAVVTFTLVVSCLTTSRQYLSIEPFHFKTSLYQNWLKKATAGEKHPELEEDRKGGVTVVCTVFLSLAVKNQQGRISYSPAVKACRHPGSPCQWQGKWALTVGLSVAGRCILLHIQICKTNFIHAHRNIKLHNISLILLNFGQDRASRQPQPH